MCARQGASAWDKVAQFHTDTRHAGENLADLLKHRDCLEPPPIQMCDALSRNIPKDHDLKVAHCLVHARRQFVDILESFPQQCQHVIDRIGWVYKKEEEALKSKLTPEQRLIFHQQRSGPAMEELHQWASKQFDQRLVEPNSVLGKAIIYLQRHWEPLTLFLRQPGAPIGAEMYWEGRMQLHRRFFQLLPCSTENEFPPPKKKHGSGVWTQPTPMARSKTPPRPLREALPIRMGKPALLFFP